MTNKSCEESTQLRFEEYRSTNGAHSGLSDHGRHTMLVQKANDVMETPISEYKSDEVVMTMQLGMPWKT